MPFDCPVWPPDWPEIEASVARTVNSGDWGRYHSAIGAALQKRLCTEFQVPHAWLCCSGTAALELALRALKVGPGDQVILSAYDYPGNFRTVELLGARPVLVDVAPDSLSLDPQHLDLVAGDRVRAVVATHLYGQAAAMDSLRSVCDQRDWALIEDACQVAGMRILGRPAGSFGDFATLSFGGSKLVSAGCGGALLAQSDRMAARIGPLVDRPGEVFPLGPLQAAVIDPQLDRLAEMNRTRNETVAFIEREINSQLPRWRWLHTEDRQVDPAYYKVAWCAPTHPHRQRIIDMAARVGIPIGEGFRSMSKCSDRRCDKPVPTPKSDDLGTRLFLMDHRALLLDTSRYQELADGLIQIHNDSV